MYTNHALLSDTELLHSGRLGQKWGVRNGPPYPLSRQKGDASIARQYGGKAAPSGTPQSTKKKVSHPSVTKSTYGGKSTVDNMADKVIGDHDLNEAERKKLDSIRKEYVNDSSKAAKEMESLVSEHLDRVDNEKRATEEKQAEEAKRQDILDHGTAEELMSIRRTLTKDEWNKAADRLEAEARVKKFLERPVTQQSNQNQQNNNQKEPEPFTAEKAKEAQNERDEVLKTIPAFNQNRSNWFNLVRAYRLRKTFRRGTAKQIYDKRKEYTPEQLDSLKSRFESEQRLAEFRDKEARIPSNSYLAMQKISKWAQTAGETAQSIGKIVDLMRKLDGTDTSKQNNQGQNQQNDKNNKNKNK